MQNKEKREINKICKVKRLKVRSKKGLAERGKEGIWESQKLFKGGGRGFKMGAGKGLCRD